MSDKLYSIDLKRLGLCWLRFGRQMDLVATEAGHWNADVFGMSEKESVEIEVKVSKSDLKCDHEKAKHGYFRKVARHELIPNRFFFLVPSGLEAEAIAQCEAINPAYGVIVGLNEINRGDYGAHKLLHCVRKARPLHNEPPSLSQRKKLMRRLSSELCGWHLQANALSNFVSIVKQLDKTEDIDAWSEAFALERAEPTR